jgi:hypothetical protein
MARIRHREIKGLAEQEDRWALSGKFSVLPRALDPAPGIHSRVIKMLMSWTEKIDSKKIARRRSMYLVMMASNRTRHSKMSRVNSLSLREIVLICKIE